MKSAMCNISGFAQPESNGSDTQQNLFNPPPTRRVVGSTILGSLSSAELPNADQPWPVITAPVTELGNCHADIVVQHNLTEVSILLSNSNNIALSHGANCSFYRPRRDRLPHACKRSLPRCVKGGEQLDAGS